MGVIGGSGGGYQAAFTAATGTVGQDRIDVGVSLSGLYDCSDFSDDPGIGAFIKNVANYVGTTETAALRAASPAYLADSKTAPLFLINSSSDSMPFGPLADMTTRLDAVGLTNYQQLTLPGSAHAFANWPSVKDQVVAFLASWFAGGPPPPEPTPQPSATPPPPVPTPTAAPSATPQPSVSPHPSATPQPCVTPLRSRLGPLRRLRRPWSLRVRPRCCSTSPPACE